MIEEKNSNSIRHGRWWRFVPLILWICVIFYSSSGKASMANTSRFLRPLLEMIFSSEETIYLANVIIRKIAHLAYYAILAGFAAFAFRGINIWLKKNWLIASFILVLTVASIDEFNQSFDPTRIGSISDVLLDCVGGLTMLSICYLFFRFRQTRNN